LILLLDSYSLLFRAHHALPAMNTVAGVPTAGLYGFSSLVLKLLRERRPQAMALAADSPGPSFRRARFPDYKKGRSAPPEIGPQLARLPDFAAALGVPLHTAPPELEADDVLAAAARRLADAGERVLVVSGDRDLFQVVSDAARVLYVGARGGAHALYDRTAVERRYGVAPERLPAMTALVGDSSDNLAKVPGVGGKTAANWIREHGGIDGILAHADRLEPARLRPAVAAAADQMRLNEELARLRTDIDLAEPLAAAPDPAGLIPLFTELEFTSLIPRAQKLVANSGANTVAGTSVEKPSG
jgi:DNA polymerase I